MRIYPRDYSVHCSYTKSLPIRDEMESVPFDSPDVDGEDHPPVELTRAVQQGPVYHLRRALHFGFCEPNAPPEGEQQLPAIRSRAVSSDTVGGVSLESTEASWGFEPTVMMHPFDNLKKAVQEGFCSNGHSPMEQVTTASAKMAEDGANCESTLTSQSFDSDDGRQHKQQQHKQQDTFHDVMEEECCVIETGPGTGRARRVLRALETFFFMLLVIAGTLYALHEFGVNLDIQLEPKLADEVSSFQFFSISRASGLDRPSVNQPRVFLADNIATRCEATL